jgi:hypothetical protein
MTQRRLDATRVLKRMSKVRELRTSAALGSATREEQVRRHALDEIEATCDAVALASGECLTAGQRVDTARYDMLSRMGAAFGQQREQASSELHEAAKQRTAIAIDSVQAKRHCERIDERVAALERARRQAQSVRMEEDAMDLWLKYRETP